jgi:hypothetical protein
MPKGIGYPGKDNPGKEKPVSKEKAKEILKDGKKDGKSLTKKQRNDFGGIVSGSSRLQ